MNSGRSLKITCGLSLSSIYKRMRAALKSIHWILRGWETVLYSILYHSCYITQTATELKHSEGAILIQLCLLHGGRLDVSAFKSFCELFHLELRLFSMAEECGGINVNPCSESLIPLDRGFLFIFLYFFPPWNKDFVLPITERVASFRIEWKMLMTGRSNQHGGSRTRQH